VRKRTLYHSVHHARAVARTQTEYLLSRCKKMVREKARTGDPRDSRGDPSDPRQKISVPRRVDRGKCRVVLQELGPPARRVRKIGIGIRTKPAGAGRAIENDPRPQRRRRNKNSVRVYIRGVRPERVPRRERPAEPNAARDRTERNRGSDREGSPHAGPSRPHDRPR